MKNEIRVKEIEDEIRGDLEIQVLLHEYDATMAKYTALIEELSILKHKEENRRVKV